MSDKSERKYVSRRDNYAYNLSKSTKERDSSRCEKFHRRDHRSTSSVHEERYRHRDSDSSRSDVARDSKDGRNGKDRHRDRECNSKRAAEKSPQLDEGKIAKLTSANACSEASVKVVEHDADFNWEEHRSILDAFFFQADDMIKKGSAEYDEFWVFLQKYQAFGRKQKAKGNSSHHAQYSFQPDKFNLPEKYDRRYRVNVSLLSKDVKGMLYHKHNTLGLTEEKVADFRCILLHYIDFLQKQKFARLVKVKRDQQNLPIFEHRQEIVDAVARHQVVVVAGDTGCGKSTQVPQYLLSAGYTHVACTQPRRIACISLSRRVAYETLNEYGSEVAYQVMFSVHSYLYDKICHCSG